MEINLSEMNRTKDGDVVEIEGKVITVKDPKEGEFGWSQRVTIKADGIKQGCWIYFDDKDEQIKQGAYIKIRGKVDEYDFKGKSYKSVNGNVIDETVEAEDFKEEENVSQAKQAVEKPVEKPIQEPEKDMNKVWEEKDLRIARECAIKAVTEMVGYEVFPCSLKFTGEYFKFADEIVNYIYNGYKITSEAIIKEFGGKVIKEKTYQTGTGDMADDVSATRIENEMDADIADIEEKEEIIELPNDKTTLLRDTTEKSNPHITGKVGIIKNERISQAKELVRNPHLAEPIDDTMASILQKRQIYGYINEDGEQVKGIIHSQYLTKEEEKGIGEWQDLTKKRACLMWEKWYGKEGETGERDKREKAKKEKEGSPFITKSQPIEKRDPRDETSLAKDLLIEAIQAKRKEIFLEDDEKFQETLGYNPKLDELSEEKLLKLKELLRDWKPDWMTEGKK